MSEVTEILNAREVSYGSFTAFAALSQELKCVVRSTAGWYNLTTVQQEAIEMVLHKMTRILNGDPNYIDSWVDIIGYTQRAVDELMTKEGATNSRVVKQKVIDGVLRDEV